MRLAADGAISLPKSEHLTKKGHSPKMVLNLTTRCQHEFSEVLFVIFAPSSCLANLNLSMSLFYEANCMWAAIVQTVRNVCLSTSVSVTDTF